MKRRAVTLSEDEREFILFSLKTLSEVVLSLKRHMAGGRDTDDEVDNLADDLDTWLATAADIDHVALIGRLS